MPFYRATVPQKSLSRDRSANWPWPSPMSTALAPAARHASSCMWSSPSSRPRDAMEWGVLLPEDGVEAASIAEHDLALAPATGRA